MTDPGTADVTYIEAAESGGDDRDHRKGENPMPYCRNLGGPVGAEPLLGIGPGGECSTSTGVKVIGVQIDAIERG